MEKRVYRKIWSLINLAGFIAVIILNTLATTLPLNGKDTGELSDAYPNLFVPAGITFSIWGVIYLLLAGFIVFQIIKAFTISEEASFLDKIGPWFAVSCAANSLWIIAWHWQQVAVSFLIMLVILGSLIMIYLSINKNRTDKNGLFYTLVHLPFSIYLGWITVATIANLTALFVNAGWNGFGLSDVFWTVTVITAAVAITVIMLIIRKDIGYSLVVIWAFIGILIKRTASEIPADKGVEIAAIAGLIILGGLVLFTAVKKLMLKKGS